METLILAAEHGKKTVGRHSDGFRSKTFRQINCRTFHYGYGVGLLPRTKRTSLTKGPLPQAPCEFVEKRRSLSYSELWAGPTYSNSPPPTSLPIPKFSLRQKSTVSLSFPPPQAAKSAPVSPTSSADNPFHTTVSATVTLRRMLNLDHE